MSRSTKKEPFIAEHLWKKIQKELKEKSNQPIKTWSRGSTIFPEMIDLNFDVYNGKIFTRVKIIEEMVGHKLGEFAPTRKFIKHGGRLTREIEQKQGTVIAKQTTETVSAEQGK